MNEVQHNRQVDFPKDLHSLSEFVVDVNERYIELKVPVEITEKLEWKSTWEHPTYKQFFNGADVEDPHRWINNEVGFMLTSHQTMRLYFRPEVAIRLFPWRFAENI